MEIKQILDALNEYYKTKPYLTLAGYDAGSPSLNKTEYCAYFGVLKSLTPGELQEAAEIIKEGDYAPIMHFLVQAVMHPQDKTEPVRNEKIDTIVGWFVNKRSKKVAQSRKELLRRFDYASFSEQKKIVKAFLCSNCSSDVEWAALQADKLWDKSYEDYVKEAFEHKPTESLAVTVIRHMPLDYLHALESKLVLFSRAEYCIRLAAEADSLIKKYDLNIFEILYVKARTGGKVNLTETQVEYHFFRFIFTFCQKVLLGVYKNNASIMSMPWISRVLWSLGELGYRDILLHFLQMNSFVLSKPNDENGKGEFYYAQLWMKDHYFPLSTIIEPIDFSKVRDAVEDLDDFDDLPPGIMDTIRKETIWSYSGEYKDGEWTIDKSWSITTNEYDARGILLSSEECHGADYGLPENVSSLIKSTSRTVDKGRFVYETALADGRINAWVIRDKENRIIESNINDVHYRCSYDEQGRVAKEGEDGLWENVFVRDENGQVVESYHVRSGEDPYSARHYYSRDFMGNIVESAVTEKGEHVESIVHDSTGKSVIEKINEKNGSIEIISADGQKICGMLYNEEHPGHLNHYALCYCEYDEMGDWIIRIQPTSLCVPEYYRKQHDLPRYFDIEIRDKEYEDDLFLRHSIQCEE